MKRILVIEDNLEIRENIIELLEVAGYEAIGADNGRAGIEKVFQYKPDLVVCDIMMPLLDGYGVLHIMRRNPETSGIPFIFLTARADRSEIRRGMDIGADDYISKPFGKTDLLNSIETRLKKSNKLQLEKMLSANGLLENDTEKDVVNFLSTNREIIEYKKKQTIYREGNRPLRLFYVKKGKVKTFKTNEGGKQLITGLYTEGDFFGYLPLMEGTSYKDNAEAIEATELAAIPKDDFDQLINTSKAAIKKFTEQLTHDVTQKETLLVAIAYNSLRKKVAAELISLDRIYQSDIDLSRRNLAAVAGTAPESMVRMLIEFRNERLIEIREGAITILEKEILKEMAG